MYQESNLKQKAQIGVVVIGRNEGERVLRCLAHVESGCAVVYVDSGSVDGSPAAVRELGIDVLELDPIRPFSAARARNEGWRHLLEMHKENLQFIQFVDGDCELVSGWLSEASAYLEHNPLIAGVTGRLREKHPEVSIYNRLCDAEWDRPAGKIDAFGGIVMLRADALLKVNGYNADLVAGEEPELSHRLRAAGYQLWCLQREMAHHDAAMTQFSQWFTRSVRNGFGGAFLVGVLDAGSPDRRVWQRKLLSAWLWAVAAPILVAGATLVEPWAILLGGVYLVQIARIAKSWHGQAAIAWPRAFFLVLAKWPECWGQLTYWLSPSARSFDYKKSAVATSSVSAER